MAERKITKVQSTLCDCGIPEIPPHAPEDHSAMLELERLATLDPEYDWE